MHVAGMAQRVGWVLSLGLQEHMGDGVEMERMAEWALHPDQQEHAEDEEEEGQTVEYALGQVSCGAPA